MKQFFPQQKTKRSSSKNPHLALGILKSHPWHGMDIFRNRPNYKKKNRSRDNQTANQETLLRADLKLNLCQWPLLHKGHFCYPKEEDTFTCFTSPHTQGSLSWGGVWGGGRVGRAQGHPTVWRNKYCLEFSAAWRQQRSFQSCMLFEAYLINSIKFFTFTSPG